MTPAAPPEATEVLATSPAPWTCAVVGKGDSRALILGIEHRLKLGTERQSWPTTARQDLISDLDLLSDAHLPLEAMLMHVYTGDKKQPPLIAATTFSETDDERLRLQIHMIARILDALHPLSAFRGYRVVDALDLATFASYPPPPGRLLRRRISIHWRMLPSPTTPTGHRRFEARSLLRARLAATDSADALETLIESCAR